MPNLDFLSSFMISQRTELLNLQKQRGEEKTAGWCTGVSGYDTPVFGSRRNSVDEAVGYRSTSRDLAGHPGTFWVMVAMGTCQTHLLDGLIHCCSFCHPHWFGLQPDFPCLPPQAHQCKHHRSVSDSFSMCWVSSVTTLLSMQMGSEAAERDPMPSL